MGKAVSIASLCIVSALGLASKADASVEFANAGLARDCYLIVEYGLFKGFKEVSPLDVCTAALSESLKPEERAGTLVNRSIVLLSMNFRDKAILDCRRALLIDPMLGEAHANLGIALMKSGKYQDALPELDKGIELGVRKPYLAYYSRGFTKEMLKDVKGAYFDYKQSLDLMPDFQLAADELKRFKVTTISAAPPPAAP